MAAFVEVTDNSPAERDIAEERPVDARDALGLGIEEEVALHAGKNLFNARRRRVRRIGSELQTDERIPGLAQAIRAVLGSSVLVTKGVGQSLHDAHRAIGVFFFA